jgi:hypothetical protein
MEHPKELDKAFSAAKFSAVALAVCPFLYLILVEIIRARFRPFSGFAEISDPRTLRYSFFAAAVVLVIMNRIINGRLLKRGAQGDHPEAMIRALYRSSVFAMTFAEMPALIGLALFFIKGLNQDFYVLLLASLILLFMYFPRRKSWQTQIAGQTDTCRLQGKS